jgi:AcrR family transcriptional regulator
VDTKRERARPLSPEERRAEIIAATRPLLYEHGRATTTRLIADAAGIAEGTIFRAFASKEELFDAVLEAEFDPTSFLDDVLRIDPDLELRERLVAFTTLLQRRFVGIFGLMSAMGMRKPPENLRDRFTLPVERVVDLIRLLTFSGSHPHISDQRPLSPEEIVDVVLHGVLKGSDPR